MIQKFLVKLTMSGVVLLPLLYWLTNATIPQMLLSTVAFIIISFIAGDQWILRESNNTVATAADVGIAGLYFWGVGALYDWRLSMTELVLIVAVLALVESMYHRLLQKWDTHSNAFSMEPNERNK